MTSSEQPTAVPASGGAPVPAVPGTEPVPDGVARLAASPGSEAPGSPAPEPLSTEARSTPSAGVASPPPAGRAQPRRRRYRAPLLVVLASLLAGTAGGTAAAWLVGGEASSSAVRAAARPPAANGQDPGAALPALIAKVTGSVVSVDVLRRTTDPFGGSTLQESSGTGFILAEGGQIATNAHVVQGAQRVTITFADGRKAGAAVIGTNAGEDLAVVKVGRTGLTPLLLGADHAVEVGEFVVATGNALALEGSPTVTVGIISALDRSITLSDGTRLSHLLQTDAAISAGDSGGPLLTSTGRVIGINTAAASGGSVQNIGFAIPMSRAKAILLELARLS